MLQVNGGEIPRKAGSGYAMHALADLCRDQNQRPVRNLVVNCLLESD